MMVKLSIASSTGRLDMSDMRLTTLPRGLWEISDLEDLSLAGNDLEEIPSDLGLLKSLRRLVVAGNRLRGLPEELGALEGLEGLWAHGNAMEGLPEEIGRLEGLQTLSLAGNRLESLPESLGRLSALKDLSLSGNRLARVPAPLAELPSLQRLSLNGNRLERLPGGWEACVRLEDLHLQGNLLQEVPDDLARLPAVSELSLADNRIGQLPADLSGWTSLQKLHLYGNRLTDVPTDSLLQLPSLQQLWLEGNPLRPGAAEGLLRRLATGPLPPGLRAVGLDERQLAGVDPSAVEAARAARPGLLRVGAVQGEGRGYFKLQRGPGGADADAGVDGNGGNGAGGGGQGAQRVLVVAFGSAPGLPNWGGVLRQVQAAMDKDGDGRALFDVLFVVDPSRDWYSGGDAGALHDTYLARLESFTSRYGRVLMIGDSMGATAALLFSRLATSVVAFCPQVDLRTSSIRPGRPGVWLDALQDNIHAALAASGARVRVLTGTWQHDLAQASLLERHPGVVLKAYAHDSHRLALALARAGKLAPLLREAISNEAGVPSKNVRLANML